MSKGARSIGFALAVLAWSQARVMWGAAQAAVQPTRSAEVSTEADAADDYERPAFESLVGEGSR